MRKIEWDMTLLELHSTAQHRAVSCCTKNCSMEQVGRNLQRLVAAQLFNITAQVALSSKPKSQITNARRFDPGPSICKAHSITQEEEGYDMSCQGKCRTATWGLSPVGLQLASIGAKLLVLVNIHLVRNVEVCAVEPGLLVI